MEQAGGIRTSVGFIWAKARSLGNLKTIPPPAESWKLPEKSPELHRRYGGLPTLGVPSCGPYCKGIRPFRGLYPGPLIETPCNKPSPFLGGLRQLLSRLKDVFEARLQLHVCCDLLWA